MTDIILDEQRHDRQISWATRSWRSGTRRSTIPTQPSHACRAALRMMATMDGLNARWRARRRPRAGPFKPVEIGIGLNTGDCCVGNLGSETALRLFGDRRQRQRRLAARGPVQDLRRGHGGRPVHHRARAGVRLSRARPAEGEGQDRGDPHLRPARRQCAQAVERLHRTSPSVTRSFSTASAPRIGRRRNASLASARR